MKQINWNKIKVSREIVRPAVSRILQGEYLTRRELAEGQGISVMTAGKIVEALLEAGLISETEGFAERGRAPRVIRLASQKIAWAILRMEERGCSFVVVQGDERTVMTRGIPYDEAMSPEDNEAMLRGLWHATKNQLEREFAIVGLGVILRGDAERYWKEAILSGIGAEADYIGFEEDLTGESLSRGEMGRSVLYLRPERETRTILAIGGEWAAGESPIRGQQRYDELCETILRMTDLITLDAIAAESFGRFSGNDKRLLNRLKKEWKRTRSSCPMPKLYYKESPTLSECATVRHLTELLAQEIGGALGI